MGDEEPFNPLTHDILCQCLQIVDRALGATGFAFTKLDCSGKELTDLGNKLENYKQLRHIVLSNNKLRQVDAVSKLPHLLTLQIDNNEVTSLDCLTTAEMPWCQRLDLSTNKLGQLPPLAALERLRFASFASNTITTLEGFGDHRTLEELQLQENQLTTLAGLGTLHSLKKLVLSGNQLTTLEGLNAPVLRELDLGRNKLASLEHIDGAPELKDVDLSENQLSAEDPLLPELRRLNGLQQLRSVKLAGNAGDLRLEVLVAAAQLTLIDGEPVTAEDREAAVTKATELEEAAKAKAEELARQLAEAEAAAAAAAAAAQEGGDAQDG